MINKDRYIKKTAKLTTLASNRIYTVLMENIIRGDMYKPNLKMCKELYDKYGILTCSMSYDEIGTEGCTIKNNKRVKLNRHTIAKALTDLENYECIIRYNPSKDRNYYPNLYVLGMRLDNWELYWANYMFENDEFVELKKYITELLDYATDKDDIDLRMDKCFDNITKLFMLNFDEIK